MPSARIGTSAGINLGFGPPASYERNLVPFSGGLAYEENPTITYAPVKGEQYIRHLLSPISPNFLLLSIRTQAYTRSFEGLQPGSFPPMSDKVEAPSSSLTRAH